MAEQPQERSLPAAAGQALQDAYRRNIELIYRFIYSRVGNREDAEDLTSQVFLKAVHNLDAEREEASIRSWLFHLARTTVADHWRQYYRGPTVPLQLMTPDTTPQPVDAAQPDVASAKVAKLLTDLPENYRRVLQLRFLEGLSVRETAAEMGTTEGNVKVLQYRALRRAAELGGDLL